MEAYETLGILGEGTYGVVMKARSRATGKLVAIKRFKQTDEDDHVRKTSTREVRMLQQLKHPNVVRLEDVFRREGKLYLVFEYIDNTILQVLESTTHGISPRDLRRYTYQLLRGIEFCHAHNVIHRDVKPENVLIDQSGMLKLCDFGFARQMTSKGKYTDYVATRWYRAPELLVGDVCYGKPVDVWALGCMFAELSDGQPLFPGESDLDQLCLIIQTCGPVPDRMVSIFEHNPLYRNVSYPHTGIVYTLQERYHRQPEDWLEFLYACLHPDPAKRLTCTELMALPYFTRDGFRERYEQELRAVSGLPLLRTNPIASAPSPVRRAVEDQPTGTAVAAAAAAVGGPKNVLDMVTPVNANTAGAVSGSKGDGGKHGNTDAVKTKQGEKETGFLPLVGPPAVVVTPEGTGQHQQQQQQPPLLQREQPSPDTTTSAGATAALALVAQEEAAKSPSTHRRHGPTATPDTTVAPASPCDNVAAAAESLKGKASRSEPFSQSCSAVLSSRRTSFGSSITASPMKKADHIVIGSTYPESSRRFSNMADSTEGGGGGDGRHTPAAAVIAAHAVNGTEAVVAGNVGGSRRTSRSSFSNPSPRSTSLHSDRGEGKVSLSAATPSSSVSSPNTITDAVLKAASGQPYLTPLADRLPDLTSPKLHLHAHDKRGSVDPDDIPKPPSQSTCPTSPTSFGGDGCSPPSLNPLARPPSRDRGAAKHTLSKARRNGPYDVGDGPHVFAKKKLAKRKKDGLGRRGSHGTSSRSTSHLSPQEQMLEALRARGVNGHAAHDGAKQGSASVSAFKLLTSRSSSRLPDTSRSYEPRTEDSFDRLPEEEERMGRGRGNASGHNTPATTANAKRGVDTRGSMPRKERRSKPLHAAPNSPPQANDGHTRTAQQSQPPQKQQQHQASQQPRPPLDPLLQPDGSDVAQRASATLLVLSALRDSTAGLHQSPHDAAVGGPSEKYPYYRHTQAAGGNGADHAVPPPPKPQTKDSGASPAKKTSTTNKGRKPLGVYTLQSTRRSIDDGEAANGTLHVHDTSTLASLPSSQYGGFAVPYRRTSKTGSNGGLPQTSTSTSTSVAPQPPAAKKPRKKRSSISGDVSGGSSSVMPYAGGHLKDSPSPPAPMNKAATMEKSTPRLRENSGSSKTLLPHAYNAAAATAMQM